MTLMIIAVILLIIFNIKHHHHHYSHDHCRNHIHHLQYDDHPHHPDLSLPHPQDQPEDLLVATDHLQAPINYSVWL